MRISLLKICIVLIALGIMSAGCSKTELLELTPGPDEAMIEYDTDSIGFVFCLLNEDSIPSTRFKKGENFRFYFAIKNNSGKHLTFYDYDFYHLNDFFAVKSKMKNYGKPFQFIRPDLTEAMRYIFAGGYALFSAPWHEDREEFYAMHGYFKGLEKPFPEKGKYYTEFTSSFKVGDITTPNLKFRIDFVID
jgi:hypothetical protein